MTRPAKSKEIKMKQREKYHLFPDSIVAKKARHKRTWRCVPITLLLVCALGFLSQTYALTYPETEPNDPCSSAQNLLSAVLPLQVEGYKTQPFGDAVDYYRFSATPGSQLHVILDGNFSKPNPLTAYGVGFFTSDCPVSPVANTFTIFSAANLDFTVPADGTFILGVTACCDTNFSGSGTIEGEYVLSVGTNLPPADFIDSISGQITDAITGRPLAGPVDPFALVQLYRSSPFGFEFVAEIPTDENGNYLFSAAVVGNPLLVGDYRIVSYANQYQTMDNSVDMVNVQVHEARIAPVLTLLSNPVRFTDVKPCDAIPAQGGNCNFSFMATDSTADIMKGAVWSLVKASGTGGLIDATEFLACEQPLTLIPGKRTASKEVRCGFTVPASVPDNAIFCPDARFGEGSRANPHFTVQGLLDPLFCLTKLPGQGSLQVLPQPAAVELMRHKGNHR
jgi:hypothetical protein